MIDVLVPAIQRPRLRRDRPDVLQGELRRAGPRVAERLGILRVSDRGHDIHARAERGRVRDRDPDRHDAREPVRSDRPGIFGIPMRLEPFGMVAGLHIIDPEIRDDPVGRTQDRSENGVEPAESSIEYIVDERKHDREPRGLDRLDAGAHEGDLFRRKKPLGLKIPLFSQLLARAQELARIQRGLHAIGDGIRGDRRARVQLSPEIDLCDIRDPLDDASYLERFSQLRSFAHESDLLETGHPGRALAPHLHGWRPPGAIRSEPAACRLRDAHAPGFGAHIARNRRSWINLRGRRVGGGVSQRQEIFRRT